MDDRRRLLDRTAELANDFLDRLPDRPVGSSADLAELRAAMGARFPDEPQDAIRVVEDLARAAEPGLVGTAGPRYFGFVVGGSLPAALGADWLTSTWDQNTGLYALSPASAVAEEVAASWLIDAFGLPARMDPHAENAFRILFIRLETVWKGVAGSVPGLRPRRLRGRAAARIG